VISRRALLLLPLLAACGGTAGSVHRSSAMSDLEWVLAKLDWMRKERIWPNGRRYLWTDAFGVVLLVSLYRATGEQEWLNEATWVVREVERVLGRKRGIRIGEAADATSI
jgi:hypothetical protein